MLTFAIEGRDAMPVRAIPFATGGCFHARRIIDLFYDPESWDEGPDTAAGEPPPSAPGAFRIGSDGVVSPASPTFWSLPRAHAKHHDVGAPDASEQLRLLPAAVFVWLDEFEPFYTAYVSDMEAVRPAPAGAFGWEPGAVLSKDEEMVVWEGFAPVRSSPARPRKQQRNSRAALLVQLKAEIDAIIAEATQKGFPVDKRAMPGKKIDLIQVLRHRNSRWVGRDETTYTDDFSDLGLLWDGGKNRVDRRPFLACFELEPIDEVKDLSK